MEIEVLASRNREWLHLVPHQRQSEGHVSVRFGNDAPLNVYLNGQEISKDCVEAQAGSDGWVILVDKPVAVAKRLDYRKEYGVVRIEGELRSSIANDAKGDAPC